MPTKVRADGVTPSAVVPSPRKEEDPWPNGGNDPLSANCIPPPLDLTFLIKSPSLSSKISITRVAFCDAGTGFSEDYISTIQSESIINLQYDSLKHSTKQYNLELKPLFSAFMWRNLALTSLRSFLLFYLPLVEPRTNMDDDDDDEDFLKDAEEDRHVDLVTPFKKSVKQIGREHLSRSPVDLGITHCKAIIFMKSCHSWVDYPPLLDLCSTNLLKQLHCSLAYIEGYHQCWIAADLYSKVLQKHLLSLFPCHIKFLNGNAPKCFSQEPYLFSSSYGRSPFLKGVRKQQLSGNIIPNLILLKPSEARIGQQKLQKGKHPRPPTPESSSLTAVVTTRRVLERLAVHYVSQRMAWKLLKDVPKSAARKAQRGMPSMIYFCSVTKTTCRGHFLGVLASWFVQVGIDIWRFFKSKQDDDTLDGSEKMKLLGRKISIVTVRCSASLVFASIGAGIGAMMFRPTTGQWIGCAIGDVAGPVIVAFCFDKVLHMEL
ncbi:hypothetical protein KY284_020624 [Solanum tuberosum]|nr:hypothetical protein KY284_020624 [Solanum tuberosum]